MHCTTNNYYKTWIAQFC